MNSFFENGHKLDQFIAEQYSQTFISPARRRYKFSNGFGADMIIYNTNYFLVVISRRRNWKTDDNNPVQNSMRGVSCETLTEVENILDEIQSWRGLVTDGKRKSI